MNVKPRINTSKFSMTMSLAQKLVKLAFEKVNLSRKTSVMCAGLKLTYKTGD